MGDHSSAPTIRYPLSLGMSSMGEEVDKTEEAKRAHSSPVSLSRGPCVLLTMSPRTAGTQAASSMQRVQNCTRDLLVGLHQPKHHKAAAISRPCSEPGLSQPSPAPYRGVVLHDGVVQLVALAGSPGEEAGLADIHIELLQAPIPGEVKRP